MKEFKNLTGHEVEDFKYRTNFDDVLVALLFSETMGDDCGTPLDNEHDIESIDADCVNGLCEMFYRFMNDDNVIYRLNDMVCTADGEQIAHDFWFTLRGHGVGYWDRPEFYGIDGAQHLTNYLDVLFGEIRDYSVYLGDDGVIYISGLEKQKTPTVIPSEFKQTNHFVYVLTELLRTNCDRNGFPYINSHSISDIDENTQEQFAKMFYEFRTNKTVDFVLSDTLVIATPRQIAEDFYRSLSRSGYGFEHNSELYGSEANAEFLERMVQVNDEPVIEKNDSYKLIIKEKN